MDHINQNQVQQLPWKVFHKLILPLRQEQKKNKNEEEKCNLFTGIWENMKHHIE